MAMKRKIGRLGLEMRALVNSFQNELRLLARQNRKLEQDLAMAQKRLVGSEAMVRYLQTKYERGRS